MNMVSSTGQSPKILVVEDDEGIRETIRFALEIEGYEVLTAENGRVGLSILESKSDIALILLDMMMPVMSGWEFIDEIKKDSEFKKVPLVIVTAVADQAKTADALAIIRKPIDLNVLYDVVRKHRRDERE